LSVSDGGRSDGRYLGLARSSDGKGMTAQFVISTLITVAIGIAAWIIAFQQLRLNRTLSSEQLRLSEAKLKFDLYERRLTLFRTVKEFAGKFAITGEADTGAFYHDTIERHFLFEKDVSDYIGEMYDRALQAKRTKANLQRENLDEGERERLIHQHGDEMNWFYEQEQNVIRVFSRDLSIRTLGQSEALVERRVDCPTTTRD